MVSTSKYHLWYLYLVSLQIMLLPILITKLSYKYILMFKTMIEFFSSETWWLEDLSWVLWTAFKFPHSAACLLSMIHVMILKAFSMKHTAKIKQWIEQKLEKFVNCGCGSLRFLWSWSIEVYRLSFNKLTCL